MKTMPSHKQHFLDILEQHQKIIFMVCGSYCLDPEDQKDLAQEIIIQLWNNFEKFDPRFKRSTWIYRIALNVAISFYRKTSTRIKHEQGFADYFLEVDPNEMEVTDNRVKQLREFINELDEMNKALMLLYLDGNSHQDIGEILNISTSNVGTKINRIKKKIKEQFLN